MSSFRVTWRPNVQIEGQPASGLSNVGLATTGCNHLVVAEINLAGLCSVSFLPEQQAREINSLFKDRHKIAAVHQQY